MANDPDREAANKFWLEAEFYEVPRLGLIQDFFRRFQRAVLGSETDGGLGQTPADDFFQSAESAANNEQNMLGVDGAGGFAAALVEIHHGLDLASDVVRRASRDFGFFHEFQQIGLHAASADVATGHVVGGGYFIDLVDIDDPILGAGHVTFGKANEIANHIFDVSPDVAGLREFGGIGFDKGDTDQIRGVANQE